MPIRYLYLIGGTTPGQRLTLLAAALIFLIAGSAGAQERLTVTSAADDGPGSLRLAIQSANDAASASEIVFDLTGDPPYVINLSTPLPPLSKEVHIDGTSQPGYAGAPLINVRHAEGSVIAFEAGAENSTLRGLSITGAGTTNTATLCIRVAAAGVQIVNSYAGLLTDGRVDGCGVGIRVLAENVIIGGSEPADRVAVGGNRLGGIDVNSAVQPANTVIDHVYVGIDPTGVAARRNTSYGINLRAAERAVIRNSVISGSDGRGVMIAMDARHAVIQNSRIGTNAAGTAPIFNAIDGILSTADNVIIEDSQISGNRITGIRISPGDDVIVRNNLIGTDAAGMQAIPNGTEVTLQAGISAAGVDGLRIENNTVSGNISGIHLLTTTDAVLHGNRIGVDATGEGLLLNDFTQLIVMNFASGTQIGGTEPGQGNIFGIPSETPNPDVPLPASGILIAPNAGAGNIVQTPLGETLALMDVNLLMPEEEGIAKTQDIPIEHGRIITRAREEAFWKVITSLAFILTPALIMEYHVSPDEAFVGSALLLVYYVTVRALIPAKRRESDGDLVRIVAIGTDTYSEDDRTACEEPPCPKQVQLQPPVSIAPGDLLLALAIDETGETGEFSEAVVITGDPTHTESETPLHFALHPNYPNPFNPSTTIPFDVPQHAHVVLKVYDLLGREVATLVNGDFGAGHHTVRFDASGLPSGMYVYVIRMGDFRAVRRMVVVK